MTDLPPLTYGRVVGRFVAGVADSDDAGVVPDVVPLAGTVTFTLSAASLRVVSASPVPTTVYPQPVTASLDADGYLTQNGSRGVSLLATDDPSTNPTDLQYTVSLTLWTPDGNGVNAPSWRFALPGGTEVDLTQVAPIETPAANTIILKGERGDPGPNTVPTVQAVADAVTTPGPAREALLGTIAAADAVVKAIKVGEAARFGSAAFDPPPAVDTPLISKTVTSGQYTWTIPSVTQHRPLRTTPGDNAAPGDMANDTKFRISGTTALNPNGTINTFLSTPAKPGGVAGSAYWPMRVEFETAAPAVEFLTRSTIANGQFGGGLKVNGRWVQETDVTHTNSAGQWLFTKLTFPDARMRRIEVTLPGTAAFFGVGVTSGYGVFRPKEPVVRRIAFVGDSFTGGAGVAPGGASETETWALRMATLLGADDHVLAGIGGTKWAPAAGATGDAAIAHFAGRLPAVLAMEPHVIVFMGSRNDSVAADVAAAVPTTLALCANVPEVYVAGTASPGGGWDAINAAVKSATLAAKRPFVDLSRVAYGTGKVGTPTNDGNADFYIGTDGVHPTHEYQKALASKYHLGIVGLYRSV